MKNLPLRKSSSPPLALIQAVYHTVFEIAFFARELWLALSLTLGKSRSRSRSIFETRSIEEGTFDYSSSKLAGRFLRKSLLEILALITKILRKKRENLSYLYFALDEEFFACC
jgi:hypothetical protein